MMMHYIRRGTDRNKGLELGSSALQKLEDTERPLVLEFNLERVILFLRGI